jgi:hypothetical protein
MTAKRQHVAVLRQRQRRIGFKREAERLAVPRHRHPPPAAVHLITEKHILIELGAAARQISVDAGPVVLADL